MTPRERTALRTRRIRLGLTQEELAEILGVSVSIFRTWETGRGAASYEDELEWQATLEEAERMVTA